MCLWKLELGSVHFPFNLWEKCVLSTIACQIQSFLFPGPFSVELQCLLSRSGLFYLEDVTCGLGALGSGLWDGNYHEVSINQRTPKWARRAHSIPTTIQRKGNMQDGAEGKPGCSTGFSWPHWELRSWRDPWEFPTLQQKQWGFCIEHSSDAGNPRKQEQVWARILSQLGQFSEMAESLSSH